MLEADVGAISWLYSTDVSYYGTLAPPISLVLGTLWCDVSDGFLCFLSKQPDQSVPSIANRETALETGFVQEKKVH